MNYTFNEAPNTNAKKDRYYYTQNTDTARGTGYRFINY